MEGLEGPPTSFFSVASKRARSRRRPPGVPRANARISRMRSFFSLRRVIPPFLLGPFARRGVPNVGGSAPLGNPQDTDYERHFVRVA